MTQPRREDEVALYARLRAMALTNDPEYKRQPGIRNVEAAGKELSIPDRRLDYLLEKWVGKGWWEYGMCATGGWFEPEAPESL